MKKEENTSKEENAEIEENANEEEEKKELELVNYNEKLYQFGKQLIMN